MNSESNTSKWILWRITLLPYLYRKCIFLYVQASWEDLADSDRLPLPHRIHVIVNFNPRAWVRQNVARVLLHWMPFPVALWGCIKSNIHDHKAWGAFRELSCRVEKLSYRHGCFIHSPQAHSTHRFWWWSLFLTWKICSSFSFLFGDFLV